MRVSIIFLVMIVLVMAVKICIIVLVNAIMGSKGENVMDAVKFFKERQRMCDTYAGECFGCPLSGEPCGFRDADAERVVGAVEKWSAAHPRKTRQSVFLERYPEAQIDDNGVLCVCPASMSPLYRKCGGGCRNIHIPCGNCRSEFWSQEVQ